MNDPRQRRRFLLVQALTGVRIPLAIVFAVAVPGAAGSMAARLGCLALLLALEASDLLDGSLARRFGVVSTWGQAFDPFVDSVSRLLVYWSLAAAGLTLGFVPLVMALRDVTVFWSRVLASTHGGSIAARRSGKVKAWVQGSGAILLLLAPLYAPEGGRGVAAALSWVVAGVTALSAIEYVAGGLAAMRAGEEP